jgi:hypothetical protein
MGGTMPTISQTWIVLATGWVLAGCAGTGPQDPSATSAAGAKAQPVPMATANSGGTRLPKGFRRMTKDGQDYVCRRETAPGSRTEIVETCLTAAEFEERTAKGQDFLQGMQNATLQPPVGNKAFTPGF